MLKYCFTLAKYPSFVKTIKRNFHRKKSWQSVWRW